MSLHAPFVASVSRGFDSSLLGDERVVFERPPEPTPKKVSVEVYALIIATFGLSIASGAAFVRFFL